MRWREETEIGEDFEEIFEIGSLQARDWLTRFRSRLELLSQCGLHL
ncbi:hypothetical protein VDG1235_2188 [Verrucomicrobiia bacterium DG1235]|nr:hypothetical protein VDG1235_2188 [Verrucomicrobiae bacterium DG1235]